DDVDSGFPWLTGRKQAQMIQYAPQWTGEENSVQVVTPDGRTLDIASEAMTAAMSALYERPARLIYLSRGTFDSMPLSLISTATVAALCTAAGVAPDARRFRPTVVIELSEDVPFGEEAWLGLHARIGNPADEA